MVKNLKIQLKAHVVMTAWCVGAFSGGYMLCDLFMTFFSWMVS